MFTGGYKNMWCDEKGHVGDAVLHVCRDVNILTEGRLSCEIRAEVIARIEAGETIIRTMNTTVISMWNKVPHQVILGPNKVVLTDVKRVEWLSLFNLGDLFDSGNFDDWLG